MRILANMQRAGNTNINYLEKLVCCCVRPKLLFALFSLFIFFITIDVAHSAMTTQSYVNNRFDATDSATKIAVVTTDVNGNPVVANTKSISDITNAITGLSVGDILTGTDTENKLSSAQTLNAAIGGYATTAGTASAYTATIPGFVLQDGAKVRLKMHAENNANATLNINGTGAKNIQVYIGTNMPAYYLIGNSVADFVYDAVNDKWLVVGSAMTIGDGDLIRVANGAPARRYSGGSLKQAMLTYGGAPVTTAGTAAAYTITDSTSYTSTAANLNAGTKVIAKMHATNADAATLNLNSMGAKAIYFNNSPITSGLLQAGGTYNMVYDGTNWNIVMSPNAGTIPLPTAECLNVDKNCVLRFGKLNPSAGPGQSGSGAVGYYWEIVER